MRNPVFSLPIAWAMLSSAALLFVAGAHASEPTASTVRLGAVGSVTTWSATDFRWRDIGDALYTETYREDFIYTRPVAVLAYATRGTTFRGRLFARGLKPNFAYQFKLVGLPETDALANERLGRAGRWWRDAPTPGNATDAEADAHGDDPAYRFLGYLLFEYLVTNAEGDAVLDFAASGSYHVLWKTTQRDPGAEDGRVRRYGLWREPAHAAYEARSSFETTLYAEHEPGRAAPGELVLPAGEYRCQCLLTEESFHQTHLDGGGRWAAALGADVAFTIDPSAEDATPPLALLALSRAEAGAGETVTLRGTAAHLPKVDVYLGMTGPDGIFRSLRQDERVGPSSHTIPFAHAWTDGGTAPVRLWGGTLPPGLPAGEYTWQVRLVRPDEDPLAVPSVAEHTVTLRVTP